MLLEVGEVAASGLRLTYARMRLLGTLHRNGSQIMSESNDDLGVARRNVTALVNTLEEEGLIRRRPHPTGGRP